MKILSSQELLEQQLSETYKSQNKELKPVEPAKSAGISYNAELQRMVLAIRRDIDELVVPQVKSLEPDYTADSSIKVADGWYDIIARTIAAIRSKYSGDAFKSYANRTASEFVQAANYSNAKQTQEQFSRFGVDIFTGNEKITEYLNASSSDNARLIQSIPEQYLTQVESVITTNMRSGNRPSAITNLLRNQFGVTKNRAKMIARDQTSKINSNLAEKRMRGAGVKYFKWMDSNDSRVRDRHEAIANRITKYGKGIYAWDNLPLSDKGVPIAPGEDFSCRCIARPVLQYEVDENIKNGKTNPNVKR